VEIITAHAGRCAQVAAVAAMLDRTELGGVNPAGTPPAGREVADRVVEAVTTGNVTWRDHHPGGHMPAVRTATGSTRGAACG
jgi:hypothetical protein